MKTTGIFTLMFKLFSLIIVLSFFATSIMGCSLFRKKYEKKETKEYKLSVINKKKIQLDNLNGDIKIKSNSFDNNLIVKADITVYLTKKELDKEDDYTKVSFDTTESTIRISTERKSTRNHFVFFGSQHDKINYEIDVPSGISVSVDNTNGRITLEKMDNDVKIDLVNGDIKFSRLSGQLDFDVTNGKIKGDADSTKGMSINTVNGNVELTLSEYFTGKFNMQTVNGKISKKDFNFKNTNEEKRSFKGELGSNGPDVKIETVNGKITLKKKDSATQGSNNE